MSQHSDLELVFHTPQEIQSSKTTLEEWRNDQARIGALQVLSVRSWDCDFDGPVYQDFVKSLVQLFESGKDCLQNFQTLEWEVNNELPPSLLHTFEANYPSWTIHLHSSLDSAGILPSPAMTSFTAELSEGYISNDETAIANLQSIVQSSKNLKKLHLRVNVHGCVRYHYSTNFSENGETFPPLEELVLEHFEVTQSCGEYWLKAMDWSHLRALDLREGSFSTPFLSLLLPIADKLPTLESIGLKLPDSSLSLTRQLFLTARPQSLLDIRVHGHYQSLLPDILNHHATSLKSLSLHERETANGDNQRVPLPVEELKDVGTRCIGLEALALDVNILKEHTWPNDIIDALVSPRFSSLKKLMVFSLIGISGERIQQPDGECGFALATTEADFKTLSSSLSATSLEEIKVQIGEKWTIMGRPMSWVLWENRNRKVLKTSRKKNEEAFSSISTCRDD